MATILVLAAALACEIASSTEPSCTVSTNLGCSLDYGGEYEDDSSGRGLLQRSVAHHSEFKTVNEHVHNDAPINDPALAFCDQDGLSLMRGSDPVANAEVDLKNRILNDITDELSNNNVDQAAKDVFSFYVCVRWIPDATFWRIAKQELTEQILSSAVENGGNVSQVIAELYQNFKFVPLLCSRNLEVYGERSNATFTYYRRFEEDVLELSNWLQEAEKKPVLQNLSHADEAFCGEANTSMNSQSCDLKFAATSWANQLSGYFGGWVQTDYDSKHDRWAMMEKIFKSFDSNNALQNVAWNDDLAAWKERFPYHSFVANPEGLDSKNSPKSTERFMVCFGKRVASEMHRRPSGNYIITDQNSVGCYGWWSVKDVAGMLKRTVELWRPPTCKLAGMSYLMKKQLLELYVKMNEDLYNALPSMVQDDQLEEEGFEDQPFNIESLEKDGITYYDHMRVASVKGDQFKKAQDCWVWDDCDINIKPGAAGNLKIQGGKVTVTWDDDPEQMPREINLQHVQIVPQEYRASIGSAVKTVISSLRHVHQDVKDFINNVWGEQYMGLASMMSNSITKWVVCPLRANVSYTTLDQELGTEDAALGLQLRNAYSKWTGFEKGLPGEVCKSASSLVGDEFPGCQVCDISEMNAAHPEKYVIEDGSEEEFLCPLVPPLEAVEQLGIFKNKGEMCVLRMTKNQQRQYLWQYNGHFPARKQNEKKVNLASTGYELVKLLSISQSAGPNQVSFGRTCSMQEKKISPRFCKAPELRKTWSSMEDMASAVGSWLGGTLGVPVDALRQLITNYKSVVAQNMTRAESSQQIATVVGEQAWDSLLGLGRFINSGVNSAAADLVYELDASNERHARAKNKLFGSDVAGDFLHSISFQSEAISDLKTTSTSKQKYRRYAVVCPCSDFDPAMELALRYKWSEIALHAVREAFRYTPEIFEQPSPSIKVRGEARLFWSKNEVNENQTYYVYGATISSGIKAPTECQIQGTFGIGSCIPADECEFTWSWYSGQNCAPKANVPKAKVEWQPVQDLILAKAVGGSPIGQTSLSTLKALTLRFYCGRKSEFGESGGIANQSDSMRKCMEEGVEKNAAMKAQEPWRLYFPDEVIVVAIFDTIDESKCISHHPDATKMVCAGAIPTEELDGHLRKGERDTGEVAYWGMHAGSGFPDGTVNEITLKPEDALRVTALLL